ncbi:MAG: hypothetical protein IJN61_04755 [Clostridia bacterium]|nr:hypothetical protein [Clostridia bacterium]
MLKSFIKNIFLREKYDFQTLEGINSIKIPNYKPLQGMSSPVNNVEYILQRKATEHKKNGKMDLAIACLKKANEIFPYSNFAWSEKDYMRLVEYLKQDRQFDEARKEEQKIKEMFQKTRVVYEGKNIETNIVGLSEKDVIDVFGGLVESFDLECCCEECAKYAKRIFSIDGKDKRFPRLPDCIKYYSDKHKYCRVPLNAFLFGVNEPKWEYSGNIINWSNREYKDERSKEQKESFKKRVKEKEEVAKDKEFYDLMFEKYPEVTPKSFGGFRRMKASNSENYKKLLKQAEELLGYDFYKEN